MHRSQITRLLGTQDTIKGLKGQLHVIHKIFTKEKGDMEVEEDTIVSTPLSPCFDYDNAILIPFTAAFVDVE